LKKKNSGGKEKRGGQLAPKRHLIGGKRGKDMRRDGGKNGVTVSGEGGNKKRSWVKKNLDGRYDNRSVKGNWGTRGKVGHEKRDNGRSEE